VITVRGDDRLKAVVLAVKAAPREVRKAVTDDTKTVIGPVWTTAVNDRARTRTDQLVIAKGARIKGGNPPVAVAASSTRKLKGGLIPADSWGAFEFGASTNRDTFTTYTGRSRKGKPYPVKRRTRRQLPPPNRKGRVAFAAFSEVAPRAVSLWVQSVVRAYFAAFDGKR